MVGGDSSRFFKDTEPFIVHPGGALESRLELQSGSITPNRLFYVLHNGERAVDVDASTWRLRVEGDAVERPLTVTYEDIRGMPSRSLTCYLECAGNHRAMFDLLGGRRAGSPPWGTGAVGNAEWTGVPLAHVLGEAGIAPSAASVLLVGLDTTAPEGGFRKVLPVHKAMHPDTLLAYEMNGEVLPRDHGFPLRAVVPGWVGANSIKWLGRIVVSAEEVWTRNNTNHVLIREDGPYTSGSRWRPRWRPPSDPSDQRARCRRSASSSDIIRGGGTMASLRPTRSAATERTCSACALESIRSPVSAAVISTWNG